MILADPYIVLSAVWKQTLVFGIACSRTDAAEEMEQRKCSRGDAGEEVQRRS